MTTWKEQIIRRGVFLAAQDGRLIVTQSGEKIVCNTGAPQAWDIEAEESSPWLPQPAAGNPWSEI